MPTDIAVRPIRPHEYAVNVTEGHETTAHRVVVPEDLLEEIGPVDEQLLVREAIAAFLDHEKATELPADVSLDELADQIPELMDEVTARLS